MAGFAQSGLQASDAFTLTPSNTLDVVSDPNNKKGYKFVYVHVQGTAGNVQVTPVDGQGGPYNIVTTLAVGTGGTGYSSGTINGVTLTYLSGTLSSNVVANITVASGIVTGVTYVSGGVGADTTTVFQYTGGQQGGLGGGSGLTVTVSAASSTAADNVVLAGLTGNVVGVGMPIAVRRVWVTNTTATNLVAFVTKGGLGS